MQGHPSLSLPSGFSLQVTAGLHSHHLTFQQPLSPNEFCLPPDMTTKRSWRSHLKHNYWLCSISLLPSPCPGFPRHHSWSAGSAPHHCYWWPHLCPLLSLLLMPSLTAHDRFLQLFFWTQIQSKSWGVNNRGHQVVKGSWRIGLSSYAGTLTGCNPTCSTGHKKSWGWLRNHGILENKL